MPHPAAIVFDLYGTLVRIREPLLHKRMPRLLGVGGRDWVRFLRERLLVSELAGREELVRLLCATFAPDAGASLERQCRSLVDRELDSIETCPGALSLLAFLQRRGHRLGLISNLTGAHKEAIRRFGLDERFDAVALSCDEGMAKPDPRIYRRLLQRLEVEPAEVLMVGDSLPHDVRAPRALGMSALRVEEDGGEETIGSIARLGWMLPSDAPDPLLAEGDGIELGERRLRLTELRPLSDDDQGRYNLVASARGRTAEGEVVELFCKRFLFPEAAHVEEFAWEVMAMAGMPACDATATPGAEPCLVMERMAGEKLDGPVDPPLAFEVGRQCAVAYIFANADLRPRNALVTHDHDGPGVTLLDLEHMFFNLAIETEGLADPLDPGTFDRMSEEELAERLRREVLSERTTRRAMRTFVVPESPESELGRAFRDGWVDGYRGVQAVSDRICDRMGERVYAEPHLIIGTRGYRRAMARIDVDDIRSRIGLDPETIFPRLAVFAGRS